MTLYIFTEESSAEKCFESLLTKIFLDQKEFKIFSHGGRENLKQALRKTLPRISQMENAKILVTIDQDKNDCKKLKQDLQNIFHEKCHCPYKIRIVCKELESWFLGDFTALSLAYPKFKSEKYLHKADMRYVDKIDQPSKKLLKMIVETDGRKFLSKGEISEKISPHLNISHNNSPSFNQTIQAIKFLSSNDDK